MSGAFDVLSGAQALRTEGKSAQNIAEFKAQAAEQRAIAEKKRAAFAQKRQAKKSVAIKSALEAKLAVAGGLASPVAADLIAEQAAELELENLLIGFEGEVLAQQALNQAELDRLQGLFAKRKGKAAARQANIGFGIQLATLGLAARGSPSGPTGNQAGSTLLTGFA